MSNHLQLERIKKSTEGEYEIVSELGKGSFGIALKVRKIENGEKKGDMVLKVLEVKENMFVLVGHVFCFSLVV
jgi:hypothetical protein